MQFIKKLESKLIPVILCGGVGTRLWPLSRALQPKHFAPLMPDGSSLLAHTLKRCDAPLFATAPVMLCCETHRFLVMHVCATANLPAEQMIVEPVPRDTGPAILSAALILAERDPEALLLIMPSDHYVEDTAYFLKMVHHGIEAARADQIVTFGIKPTYPETGFGYITLGNPYPGSQAGSPGFKVSSFIEKPPVEEAKKLIEGGALWNSGLFLFKARFLIAMMQRYQPILGETVQQAVSGRFVDHGFTWLKREAWERVPSISVDYALMQQPIDRIVLPFEGVWSDVGSWRGIWQQRTKNGKGNVCEGDVIVDAKTRNSYFRATDRLIAAVGVEDLAVIETPDAILVLNMDDSQGVRGFVKQLSQKDRPEIVDHLEVSRPWGSFKIIQKAAGYQIKILTILPGQGVSLQKHQHRSEHWMVLEGQALVVVGEERSILGCKDEVVVPQGVKHRLSNPDLKQNCVVVEIQMGDYLGEDDIIRFEDLYGRSV
jgi:mannose-1-phosphate guanylyltransferase/mannose-6-phosphate isomerase